MEHLNLDGNVGVMKSLFVFVKDFYKFIGAECPVREMNRPCQKKSKCYCMHNYVNIVPHVLQFC